MCARRSESEGCAVGGAGIWPGLLLHQGEGLPGVEEVVRDDCPSAVARKLHWNESRVNGLGRRAEASGLG